MKLSDFDYKFPEELVAQHPLPERSASRMMIVDRARGTWTHNNITDLPSILKEGDVLIVNDSKVIPARIFGERSGGRAVELLLVQKISESRVVSLRAKPRNTGRSKAISQIPPCPPLLKGGVGGFSGARDDERGIELWRCLTKRVRNYRRGDKLFFGISSTAEVIGRDGDYLIVEFGPGDRERAVNRRGVPPLPPYIKREHFASYSDEDRNRYQTIYAKELGSVAAPTAGLHFSEELLKKIKDRSVAVATVTLHVGRDTFTPVRVDDIEKHKMHGERYTITNETADIINQAKEKRHRIIAVGTTTVRALESSAKNGICHAGENETDLFMTPGYKFRIVDGLLTNFHQPKSTLLMLVCAFAGRELVLSAYADAIKNSYRLFSFGDCMLITS
jgi:S-adenosylmethionine:tRNA ribosyltransferase-isomerase